MKEPLPTDTACPSGSHQSFDEYQERQRRLNADLGQLTHHWIAKLRPGVKGDGTDRKPEDMGIVKED